MVRGRVVSDSDDMSEIETLRDELKRVRRRARRNQDKARAEGLMAGIVAMLRPGDVVCDLGANIGEVSAQLASSGATVHAFDPDPYCLSRLRERFADAPNVIIHEGAVGTRAGTIQLQRAVNFDDDPKSASVKSRVLAGGRMIDTDKDHAIDVPLIDFPAFLRGLIDQHGEVAFVKMDIEGAELELLGTLDAEKLFDKVRLTVAETHENKFKDLRPQFAALRERISANYPQSRVNLDWI